MDGRSVMPLASMIAKLNIVSTLAALVLFFFPWMDVQCSGRSMMTQTGWQAVYGDATLSPEFRNDLPEDRKDEEGPHASKLAMTAFGGGVLALATAVMLFIRGKSSPRPGIYCAIALALLLIQMAVKFPIQREFEDGLRKGPTIGGVIPSIDGIISQSIRDEVKFIYQPVFYFELFALAIPSLLAMNTLLDRLKSRS